MTKDFKKIPTVFWYGERGIINALIGNMAGRKKGFTKAAQELLVAIEWEAGNKLEWIDEIQDVRAIVELGLGQFGDPDLILVCFTDMERVKKPYIVFIEAKAITYQESMKSNSNPGMSASGFNSSINGQLTLKYRFAKSLKGWNGSDMIIEPDRLHEAYQAEMNDLIKEPRRLKKPAIFEYYLKPLGFQGLSEERCYYVALTWDNKPFFQNKTVTEDFLPRFLPEQEGRITRTRLGWLGYQAIQGNLKTDGDATYKKAFSSMRDPKCELQPSVDYYHRIESQSWEAIRKSWPDAASLAEEIGCEVRSRVAKDELKVHIEEHKTSLSIKDTRKNQVIGKIIPKGKNVVFVGMKLTDDMDIQELDTEKIEKINNQAFIGYSIPVNKPGDWQDKVEHLVTNFISRSN